MLMSRAGAGFVDAAGDEIEVADDEAMRMIAAGQAELVRDAAVERAVPKRRAEKAVRE
jgi:hypothetical protein